MKNWTRDADVVEFLKDLEAIVWLDHKSDGGWTRLKDAKAQCSVMVTVGAVVDETDEAIAITATLGGLKEAADDRDVGDLFSIGKGMILRRFKLHLDPVATQDQKEPDD